MDFIDLVVVISVPVASYIVMIQVGRALVRGTTKTAQIAGLLRQLGIKNFKPQDLNSDKVDDLGFARLVTLIKEVNGVSAPQNSMMAQLSALSQLGAAASALGRPGATLPQTAPSVPASLPLRSPPDPES